MLILTSPPIQRPNLPSPTLHIHNPASAPTRPGAHAGPPLLLKMKSLTTSSDLSPYDRLTYLFGSPIAHSLSPALHTSIYAATSLNWAYVLHESLSIPSFLSLLASPTCGGAGVTMPHKVAILPYLDALTPEGAAIGAVNTVIIEELDDEAEEEEGTAMERKGARKQKTKRRRLIGTNTDCIGIREALRKNIPQEVQQSMRGRPGLVVGGGGTCRSAIYALKTWLGCDTIYIVNRDASEVALVIDECTAKGYGANLIHVSTLEQARSLPKPGTVVSAIPDFAPVTDEEKQAREVLECLLKDGQGGLLEMCYHPRPETMIKGIAEREGWCVVGGVEAMIWQGLEQDRLWTGLDVEVVEYARVKRDIVDAMAGHTM